VSRSMSGAALVQEAGLRSRQRAPAGQEIPVKSLRNCPEILPKSREPDGSSRRSGNAARLGSQTGG